MSSSVSVLVFSSPPRSLPSNTSLRFALPVPSYFQKLRKYRIEPVNEESEEDKGKDSDSESKYSPHRQPACSCMDCPRHAERNRTLNNEDTPELELPPLDFQPCLQSPSWLTVERLNTMILVMAVLVTVATFIVQPSTQWSILFYIFTYSILLVLIISGVAMHADRYLLLRCVFSFESLYILSQALIYSVSAVWQSFYDGSDNPILWTVSAIVASLILIFLLVVWIGFDAIPQKFFGARVRKLVSILLVVNFAYTALYYGIELDEGQRVCWFVCEGLNRILSSASLNISIFGTKFLVNYFAHPDQTIIVRSKLRFVHPPLFAPETPLSAFSSSPPTSPSNASLHFSLPSPSYFQKLRKFRIAPVDEEGSDSESKSSLQPVCSCTDCPHHGKRNRKLNSENAPEIELPALDFQPCLKLPRWLTAQRLNGVIVIIAVLATIANFAVQKNNQWSILYLIVTYSILLVLVINGVMMYADRYLLLRCLSSFESVYILSQALIYSVSAIWQSFYDGSDYQTLWTVRAFVGSSVVIVLLVVWTGFDAIPQKFLGARVRKLASTMLVVNYTYVALCFAIQTDEGAHVCWFVCEGLNHINASVSLNIAIFGTKFLVNYLADPDQTIILRTRLRVL